MAKRITKAADSADGISREDLRKGVNEIKRQKSLASEYAGNAGKSTSNLVERFGLDKTALTFARRLDEMEEGKRASALRAVLEYSYKLGHFDQLDAFDSTADVLSEILEHVRTNDNSGRSDAGSEVLATLIN